jgi:DNA replication protein DnaC
MLKEYLYLILNERMLNNLSTIITTNLEPGEILTNYGERIFSRLVNKKTSICINLDGEDLRLKK